MEIPAFEQQTAPHTMLTVFSCNVWSNSHCFQARRTTLQKALAHLRPDIICLQEVSPQFFNFLLSDPLISGQYKMSCASVEQLDSSGLLTLISNNVQLSGSSTALTLPSSSQETNDPCFAIVTPVDLKSNLHFVCNIQLDGSVQSNQLRIGQLQFLGEKLQGFEQGFLCGDFNFGDLESQEKELLNSLFPSSKDVWLSLHANDQIGYTFGGDVCHMDSQLSGRDLPVRRDRIIVVSRCNTCWIPTSASLIGNEQLSSDSLDSGNLIGEEKNNNERLVYPSTHLALLAHFTYRLSLQVPLTVTSPIDIPLQFNNSSPSSGTMISLSQDMIELIFSYLVEKDLCNCAAVCKIWKDFIDNSKHIWVHQFQKHYSEMIDTSTERKLLETFGSVKRAYVYRTLIERNWSSSKPNYQYQSFKIADDTLYGIAMCNNLDIINHHCVASSSSKQDKFTHKTMVLTADGTGAIQCHLISGLGAKPKRNSPSVSSTQLKLHKLFCNNSVHKGPVWSLDFNNEKIDQLFVTGGFDGTLAYWNILTGELVASFPGSHTKEIWEAVIVDDSTIATAGQDRCVKLFDVKNQVEKRCIKDAHFGSVYAVKYDTVEQFGTHCIASGGLDGVCKIWDFRMNSNDACVFLSNSGKPDGNSVYEIAWTGNRLVVGHGRGNVEMYDIRMLSSTPLQHLILPSNSNESNSIAPQQGNSKLYSLQLKQHGAVRGIYFDGYKLLTGSARAVVTVSNAKDGSMMQQYHDVLMDTSSAKVNSMLNLDATENVMVTACSAGLLGVFDFSHVPHNYLPNNLVAVSDANRTTPPQQGKKCAVQ